MLNIYAASWCPHCQRTIAWLDDHQINFNYIDIEEQPEDLVKKVIDVNGGDDWVVPTIEFDGKWRPGKVFNESELEADLREMGVMA